MSGFSPVKCAKCGGFKLERVDKLPFCSECEKKFTQFYAERVRPDKAKKGKLVMQSEAVGK